jgi:hypothetical protein
VWITNAYGMSDNEKEKSGGPVLPDPKADQARKAEEAFIRGLIERGEAAKADEHGNLPPGATHEIIGISPCGLPIVVRRRFA